VPLVHLQHRRPCNCAGPHRAVAPGTSRCPRGAENTRCSNSIRTNTKDVNLHRAYSDRHQGRSLTGLEGLYTLSTLGHSLLRIHPPKMFFVHAIISALETLRCATRLGRTAPVLEGRMGPILERLDEAAAEGDSHHDAG
jgi:hypothetical protein